VTRLGAVGGLLGLLFAGTVIAGVATKSEAGAKAHFERLDREEPQVKVWVGAACTGGGMAVAMSLKALAPYDCRDQWVQTLTESQVRGMGVS
jgi:hypothetical protein